MRSFFLQENNRQRVKWSQLYLSYVRQGVGKSFDKDLEDKKVFNRRGKFSTDYRETFIKNKWEDFPRPDMSLIFGHKNYIQNYGFPYERCLEIIKSFFLTFLFPIQSSPGHLTSPLILKHSDYFKLSTWNTPFHNFVSEHGNKKQNCSQLFNYLWDLSFSLFIFFLFSRSTAFHINEKQFYFVWISMKWICVFDEHCITELS